MKKHFFVLVIIFCSILLFSPALTNFFSGDDWFHLKVVQISSVGEFLNFFNPIPNEQSIAFYRPIPTQLFFFVFYRLFGLNVFFYHLFVFGVFGFSLYLFYSLLLKLKVSKTASILALIIFAFSHTNFTRLYFLSAGQETMMVLFILLGLHSHLKKYNLKQNLLTLFWFTAALLSKDSAIVFPLLILLIDWYREKKIYLKRNFVFVILTLIYLYIRLFLFGFNNTIGGDESYTLSFSPRVTVNSFYTYMLWLLGGAELLKDYMSGPLSIINRFYMDFGVWGKIMLGLLATEGFGLVFITIKNIKKISWLQWGSLAVLFITTLPFLFFPNHKFAIQLTMPLMAFATFAGILLAKQKKVVVVGLIFIYMSLNLVSIALTKMTHYSVQRAEISQKVYQYFQVNHSLLQNSTSIVFLNAQGSENYPTTWGSSMQVFHALMGETYFQVVYPDLNLRVYFEDLMDEELPEGENILSLDSELFLK